MPVRDLAHDGIQTPFAEFKSHFEFIFPLINIVFFYVVNDLLKVMGKIKDVIIATDLMEYFKNRNILGPIVANGKFDWEDAEHRFVSYFVIYLFLFIFILNRSFF